MGFLESGRDSGFGRHAVLFRSHEVLCKRAFSSQDDVLVLRDHFPFYDSSEGHARAAGTKALLGHVGRRHQLLPVAGRGIGRTGHRISIIEGLSPLFTTFAE